jgi:hypothetical protein
MFSELIDYLAAHYALERLKAELDAIGATPEQRREAYALLAKLNATQRAAAEAVGQTKH